jgi:hypothetical protein
MFERVAAGAEPTEERHRAPPRITPRRRTPIPDAERPEPLEAWSSPERGSDLLGGEPATRIRRAPTGPATGIEVSERDQPWTIRRKFGFEMEVPLVLTDEDTSGVLIDPKRTVGVEVGELASDPGTSEIHVDHMAEPTTLAQLNALPLTIGENLKNFTEGPPIVEIATKGWDEAVLGEADVRTRMKWLSELVEEWFDDTSKGTVFVPDAIGDFNLAADQTKSAAGDPRANLQATYGVKTSQVPTLFAWQAQQAPNKSKSRALTNAVTVAGQIMNDVKLLPGWIPAFNGAVEAQLKGFMALLANYLLVFGRGGIGTTSGLAKNWVGQLFYKSDLAKLLNKIVEATPTLAGLLGAKATNDPNSPLFDVLDIIAAKTNRDTGDDVDSKGRLGITVENYLFNILSRRTDLILPEAKNPYSKELGPDQLGTGGGTETGPVMENRNLDLQFPTTKQQWYPTDEWEDLAAALYLKLKQINGIP